VERLRSKACDRGSLTWRTFDADLSTPIAELYSRAGSVVRLQVDASFLPPSTKGEIYSCGLTAGGKKTALIVTPKSEGG
jgi:hypothetical protein